MMEKVGRNDPCPCGSGKKYKKCCGKQTSFQQRSFADITSGTIKEHAAKVSEMMSKKVTQITPEEKTSESALDRMKAQRAKEEEREKSDSP
jgi:hypothetical protein